MVFSTPIFMFYFKTGIHLVQEGTVGQLQEAELILAGDGGIPLAAIWPRPPVSSGASGTKPPPAVPAAETH